MDPVNYNNYDLKNLHFNSPTEIKRFSRANEIMHEVREVADHFVKSDQAWDDYHKSGGDVALIGKVINGKGRATGIVKFNPESNELKSMNVAIDNEKGSKNLSFLSEQATGWDKNSKRFDVAHQNEQGKVTIETVLFNEGADRIFYQIDNDKKSADLTSLHQNRPTPQDK